MYKRYSKEWEDLIQLGFKPVKSSKRNYDDFVVTEIVFFNLDKRIKVLERKLSK